MLNFPFTAALMAGGQSRRMGYDKAGARIAGEILWKRQLMLLRQLMPAQLFISGRNGAIYPDAGCKVIADAVADAGPLGGLVSALRFTSTEFLLILAVDMPAMKAGFLKNLLVEARAGGRSVVPQGPHGFEPLAAVYHISSLGIAEECLRAGERSMRSLIARLQARQLVEIYPLQKSELPLFRNVNTPEELADVEAWIRASDAP